MEKYAADVIEKVKAQTEKTRNEETVKLTEELNKIRDSNSALIQNLNDQISKLTYDLNNTKNENSATINTYKSQIDILEKVAKERLDQAADLQKEIKQFESLENLLNGKSLDYYISKITTLKEEQEKIRQKADANEVKATDLNFLEKKLEARLARLEQNEEDFDQRVEEKCQDRIKGLQQELDSLRQEKESYRIQLESLKDSNHTFEDYKKLVEDADLLKENESLKQEIKAISEKIKRFPSQYVEMELKDVEESKQRLEADKRDLEDREKAVDDLNKEIIRLKDALNSAEFRLAETQKSNVTLKEELNRFTSGNIQDIENERQRRIEEINKPLAILSGENRPKRRVQNADEKLNEKQWLEGIQKSIQEFGLNFPKRIINAFHTALKCSDISPLTVLGGTSGTGKSELVRLYSHFGGLTFLSLPVQPDWDCQEDMLGFFNSIDNRFEAQDVLRLLAQSQRSPEEQEGLNDVMTVILLDEMNLSNPELYFADFLSKLETRRGLDENHLPSIPVKIGSGLEPEPIMLGRNVLWTGTMNNDETTKTLSDKVLDRGIVINFPRPKILERRAEKKILGEPAPLLSRDTWTLWTKAAVKFTDEEIKTYKDTIQKINDELGNAGRGLGHRVWQSIETYMANYPDVIDAVEKKDEKAKKKAMDIAFEDQIVQKVMPKLRGIENRGTQGDVLDNIEGLIPESLKEDYRHAKNMSYGQFMWCTSDYLND